MSIKINVNGLRILLWNIGKAKSFFEKLYKINTSHDTIKSAVEGLRCELKRVKTEIKSILYCVKNAVYTFNFSVDSNYYTIFRVNFY